MTRYNSALSSYYIAWWEMLFGAGDATTWAAKINALVADLEKAA